MMILVSAQLFGFLLIHFVEATLVKVTKGLHVSQSSDTSDRGYGQTRAPLHPSQSGHPTDTAGWDSAVRVDAPSAQVATFVYSPSTFLSWGLEDATQCY